MAWGGWGHFTVLSAVGSTNQPMKSSQTMEFTFAKQNRRLTREAVRQAQDKEYAPLGCLVDLEQANLYTPPKPSPLRANEGL